MRQPLPPGPRPGRAPRPSTSIVWELLRAEGISIRGLEERSGIPRPQLSRFLSGERQPAPTNLLRIMEAIAPTVAPLVFLRALIRSREQYKKLAHVRRVIDSR